MQITIGHSQVFAGDFAIYGTREDAEEICTEAIKALKWTAKPCPDRFGNIEVRGEPVLAWTEWMTGTPGRNRITFSYCTLTDSTGVRMKLSVGGSQRRFKTTKMNLIQAILASAQRFGKEVLFDHPELVRIRESVISKLQDAYPDVDIRRAMGAPMPDDHQPPH